MQGDSRPLGQEPDAPFDADTEALDLQASAADPELFSGEDLDRLYREALEVMEAAACDLTDACTALSNSESDLDGSASETSQQSDSTVDGRVVDSEGIQHDAVSSKRGVDAESASPEAAVTPTQIIEAILFVGGAPLTTKKLCGILRSDFTPDAVDEVVESLNRRYAEENRPYTIQLGEGGYRMVPRAEFESVRNRVFGIGPKEVRLSQEALEILALVAYRQPMTREEVETSVKENAGNVLRHLVRRELLSVKRLDGGAKDVQYVTTPRFLKLFGLGRLDELPQADELEIK